MESFSLITGTTFMASRLSTVRTRLRLKSSFLKSRLVTRNCEHCMSIIWNSESYSAMRPLWPAAAAARACTERKSCMRLCERADTTRDTRTCWLTMGFVTRAVQCNTMSLESELRVSTRACAVCVPASCISMA